MTVKGDLERSIAMAEAARGNYLLFATESEDKKAHQVFSDMAEDMERHVKILESRRDYLNQHNQLNAGGSDAGGDDSDSGGSDKKQNQKQNQKQSKSKDSDSQQ